MNTCKVLRMLPDKQQAFDRCLLKWFKGIWQLHKDDSDI